MAVVILEPKSATLISGSGKTRFRRGDRTSVLIMKVGLPHHAGIWLETDETSFVGDVTLSIRAASMDDIEALFELTHAAEDSLDKSDVVGSMRYSAARKSTEERVGQKAAIAFEAFVPAKFMASILRLARSGRFPKKVWLDVKGLGYRDAPRRRDATLLWPRQTERSVLPITDVSFEIPHHRQTEFSLVHSEPDPEDPDAASKASARALQLLEPIFVRISIRLFWVVWLLLAVVVGLAFWIWR